MSTRSCRYRQAIVFVAVIALPSAARATTYYVSAAGDDAQGGTLPSAAWKTIDKLNASAGLLQPGDSVLFRRGDTFRGTITPTQSGKAGAPITYGSYGAGDLPVISGMSTLSAWAPAGVSRWEVAVPGSVARVNGVVLGGVLQAMGRYPKATAPNGGYLTFTSHAGNTSITDPKLAGGPDFTGGELVVRIEHWTFDRGPITKQTGATLTFPAFADAAAFPLNDGSGYFIQNHPATLTADGDWLYDATAHKLVLFHVGSPPAVEASTLDSLVSVSHQSYLELRDLSFVGANGTALYGEYSSFITVSGCRFAFAAAYAIDLKSTSDVLIEKNVIDQSLSDAVRVYSPTVDNVTVRYNVITNTGMIAGMSEAGRLSNQAVDVRVKSGAVIQENTITNTGYIPVHFGGNDITIKNNVIDGFCSVLDDGGAVYSWAGGLPTPPFSNRIITGNVISNGIGAPHGTVNGHPDANGIYLDNDSNHVVVTDNTVFHMASLGAHLNSPEAVTLAGNTFYDVDIGFDVARWSDEAGPGNQGQEITGLDVQHNLFVSTTDAQRAFLYTDHDFNWPAASSFEKHFSAIGVLDHNTFYNLSALPFDVSYRPDTSSAYTTPFGMSLAQWGAFSGYETSSTRVVPTPSYKVNGLVGANLFPAGDFEAGITAVSSYADVQNYKLAWDTSSKVTGAGSLKLSFDAPAAVREVVDLTGAVGPISSTKKYVLRVSTVGTTETGTLRVALTRSKAPFGDLTPRQERPFGKKRVDHEFLFDAPVSFDAAAWEVFVADASGTTYLDDIQVFEVDATTMNPLDHVRFEYNATNADKVVPLATTYVDAKGTAYCGSTTLAPFSSIVLFDSTAPCNAGGAGGGAGAGAGGAAGTGGVTGAGGKGGKAGASAGGASGSGGAGGSSGASGQGGITGGAAAAGGGGIAAGKGGATGGAPGNAGASPGPALAASPTNAGGCSCVVGRHPESAPFGLAAWVGAIGLQRLLRRRRRVGSTLTADRARSSGATSAPPLA